MVLTPLRNLLEERSGRLGAGPLGEVEGGVGLGAVVVLMALLTLLGAWAFWRRGKKKEKGFRD